jgi:hypothetical protein
VGDIWQTVSATLWQLSSPPLQLNAGSDSTSTRLVTLTRTVQESEVREIRMLRLRRRELETEPTGQPASSRPYAA